jgi:hypothetical protein
MEIRKREDVWGFVAAFGQDWVSTLVSWQTDKYLTELLRYYNFLGYVVTGPTHLEIIDEAHVLLSSQTHFKEVADIT